MTSLLLVDELAKILENIFAGYSLLNSAGKLQQVKIYSQYLPRPNGIEIIHDDDEENNEPIILGRKLNDFDAIKDYSNDDYFSRLPCVCVKMLEAQDFEENKNSLCDIRLLIAGLEDWDDETKNFSNESKGWRDVLNIQEKIRGVLLANRIIGERFLLTMPVKSRLLDVESWPAYFGEMDMTFEMFRPVMKDNIYRPKRKEDFHVIK